MNRNAKIVATLGPSCQDPALLKAMIEAGLDVARLNFSHGSYEDHARFIQLLRSLSAELGKPVTILQDLQGPKIRVGAIPGGSIQLEAGQIVFLTVETPGAPAPELKDGAVAVPMDFPELPHSVHAGHHILLDDGELELEVLGASPAAVETRVVLGGALSSHKGVNLPGVHLDIPGFTEKDREDLAFGVKQGVDAVAISFVRTAEDVLTVRQALHEFAPEDPRFPIIAKLEKPEALDNLDAILEAADGVMVARGDLGVEMSPAYVPIAQKKIIAAANRSSKIVITATQMLDSMIRNPRPTRAEASDVANAIFDGTDAVMLSGETASGQYPLESVSMMNSIVQEAEDNIQSWGHFSAGADQPTQDDAVALTRAARELAQDRDVTAIAVFTQTGKTALLMAKARPGVPILAFTPEKSTYQRLGLIWGAIPFLIPVVFTLEAMIEQVESVMISSTPLKAGQQVVLISGFPVGAMRPPNFALLHTIRG